MAATPPRRGRVDINHYWLISTYTRFGDGGQYRDSLAEIPRGEA